MAKVFKALSTVTVGAGGTASVEFTNIPQTYTDLIIKISARSTKSGFVEDNFSIQPNGATSTFSWRWLYGTGSSALSTSGTNAYGAVLGTAGSTTSNVFGNSEVYIPNYRSSSYKTMSIDNANENNATSALSNLVTFLWQDTAAITSITIDAGGGDFVQYSTATLYGISNA